MLPLRVRGCMKRVYLRVDTIDRALVLKGAALVIPGPLWNELHPPGERRRTKLGLFRRRGAALGACAAGRTHGMNSASARLLLRVGREGYVITGGWSPAVAARYPSASTNQMELQMGTNQDQGNKGNQQGGSSQGDRSQSGGNQSSSDQSRQSSQGGGESGGQSRQQSGESQRGGQQGGQGTQGGQMGQGGRDDSESGSRSKSRGGSGGQGSGSSGQGNRNK